MSDTEKVWKEVKVDPSKTSATASSLPSASKIAQILVARGIDTVEKAKEFIYGDRDVDGVSSVNIIVDTVRKLGGTIEWYVSADEGYGLNKDVISKYASEKVKVLITVDCGISSNKEIDYAQTLGIDVITDYHEPLCESCPNAYAIINPKIINSNYPFKHITECVVALKLAQALVLSFSKEYNKISFCIMLNKMVKIFQADV
jgi:single-stranded-DNA-specific exonuclease